MPRNFLYLAISLFAVAVVAFLFKKDNSLDQTAQVSASPMGGLTGRSIVTQSDVEGRKGETFTPDSPSPAASAAPMPAAAAPMPIAPAPQP